MSSNGKLSFSCGNGTKYYSASSETLTWDSAGNTWYHTAVTYDGSTTNFCRDGSLVGTDPNGIGAIAAESFYQLHLGKSPVTPLSIFNGTIDEVKIYNRALTPEEILADYQKGIATGTISGNIGDSFNNNR